MTFEIDLQDFSLTDVLQFLLQTKKTGVVYVEGDSSGEIYFSEGFVVHAKNAVSEGLDALFEMSVAAAGKANFVPRVNAPKRTISEDTGKLVETIEKRRIEFQEVKENLPPMDSVFAKTTRDLESAVALRRSDWQILALIDGKRPLADVITGSKLGGYEAMKTIIWLKEKELIYEPEKAARVVSKLVTYLNLFFADFGKNGLIWFRRWASSTDANKEMAQVMSIDEDKMELTVRSELSPEQIDAFIKSFEEIVKAEGPKIYGKVLFRKKFDDFDAKLREPEE